MINTYVYFIREALGCHAHVKIGVAKNPESRLAVLQTGNSRRLEIVATIGPVSEKQAYGIERKLHKKFRKHRLRGEWFTGVIFKNLHTIREDVEMI